MYITVDDIKNEISLYHPINNSNQDKKIGLIHAYFVYSFYNVVKDEKIHLKNGKTLPVKKGCYTMKDIGKVSSGKVNRGSQVNVKTVSHVCHRLEIPKPIQSLKKAGIL